MDISHILEGLNDAQREAVTSEAPALLVLAGAGSGKTRVLVHRIAWQIEVLGLNPFSVLAVTFTNKAAHEMRQRIAEMMDQPVNGMWVGTFHTLAHRFLRRHWQEAGLQQNFQIMDSEDQQRLIKRIIRELNLDEKKWPAKQAQWFINGQKDEGIRAHHMQVGNSLFDKIHQQIYAAYDAACDRLGLVDFAELLLRSHELWLKHPEILAHYQQRFGHILVDEFQDTNTIQYAWLRLLARNQDGHTQGLTVVGDDDQSIYGWRGAKIENIQTFQSDFKGAELIRLEQNYRSTQTILDAANAVIQNNTDRLGKALWTDVKKGDPIQLYSAYSELDEARFIADRAANWQTQGEALADIAVLYRSNAQSRVLEEALLQANLAYRIYGGMRFFERAEIKNTLAYLMLIENQNADAAFERIVNFPTRGIGDKTLSQLREFARANQLSLWQAIAEMQKAGALSSRAISALLQFQELVESLQSGYESQSLEDLFTLVIHETGLLAHYKKEKSEKSEGRIDNLQELIIAAKSFDEQGAREEERESESLLAQFLDYAALESGAGQAEDHEDAIQLMTLHSAKGLEFKKVFIVGLEEGLFPSKMSLEEADGISEERRLCYVGITRAREQLVLTHAESRRLYGETEQRRQSRFIREIPEALIEPIRVSQGFVHARASALRASQSAQTSPVGSGDVGSEFHLGERVSHPRFGEGVVMNAEGKGASARIQVNFDEVGSKWLVFQYANLQKA